VEGEGKGIVIRIGAKTLLGQTAALVVVGEPHGKPLRTQIVETVIGFTTVAIALFILFFFVGRYARHFPWLDCVVFIVGIIVATVPESLAVILSLSLALAARSMHARFVLVKSLTSVETLGAVSCVCTDKTGTITQNSMTLSQLWYDDRCRRGANMQRQGRNHTFEYSLEDATFQELVRCAATTSDATFTIPRDRYADAVWLEAPVFGDATDAALVRFIQPFTDVEDARRAQRMARTPDGEGAKMPFSATHKFALCVLEESDASRQNPQYSHTVYVKGSPETLWMRSSSLMSHGRTVKIDGDWRKKFSEVNRALGGAGERVIGFAKLQLDAKSYPIGTKFEVNDPARLNFALDDLVFLGLLSFADPPREGVAQAVLRCRSAGIRVMMITGDQASTAVAVARAVNIFPRDIETNEDLLEMHPELSWDEATARARAVVISGRDIDTSVERLNNQGASGEDEDKTVREWVAKDFCIFARASPSHSKFAFPFTD
jgi:sodium/potassium-transporting ATPase subunit alpha